MNGDFDRNFFFVDRNFVNFWSPDIVYNSESISSYVKNSSFVELYGFAFQTAISSRFEIDSGAINDMVNSDPLINLEPNYYSGRTALSSSVGYRIFPSIESNLKMGFWTNIPIWSPERYKISMANGIAGGTSDPHVVDVTFTKLNKSGYNYFSINRNLINSARYRVSINNPDVVSSNNQIFYQSNPDDNTSNNGLVIYGKNVEKNYPSNTYFNTVKYNRQSDVMTKYKGLVFTGAYGDDEQKSSPVEHGFSMKYNTASHAVFSFKEVRGLTKCMPRLKNSSENPSSIGDYESFSNPS